MPDTGWLSPGTTINLATVGVKPWLNPNNSQSSDDVYSSAFGGAGGGLSNYLRATNFGASIPIGATINGIIVEFERFPLPMDSVNEQRVYCSPTGGNFGDENKADGWWAVGHAYYTYGGVADLWSQVWTPADINGVGFGVSINVSLNINAIAQIDHIRVKVYYTEPATNMKINIGDVMKDVDEIKINIGSTWKTVTKVQINIGDSWKTVFE